MVLEGNSAYYNEIEKPVKNKQTMFEWLHSQSNSSGFVFP